MIKTVRPFNLLIVAITQLIIYYKCIAIYFDLTNEGYSQILSITFLSLFILISIIITMSGYIINEYYDKESDAINDKSKSESLSKSFLLKYYLAVLLVGLLLAFYVAVFTNNLKLFWIYPFAVLLLFLYSKHYKSKGLIGNILVSIFCAFVAGMLLIAEYPNMELISQPYYEAISGFQIIGFYMLFAFFTTIYREIVKDIEDVKGDASVGHTTLPIRIGIEKAKLFAQVQGIFLLLIIGFWLSYAIGNINLIANVFLILSTIIPITYSIMIISKSSQSLEFHKISNLIKYVMVAGLLYLTII